MNEQLAPSQSVINKSKLFAVLQIVLFGIPATILTVAFSFVCCCCLPAAGNDNRERFSNCMSFWGNALTTVVIFVPGVIFFFVLFPVFFLLYCVFRIFFPEPNCMKSDEDRVDGAVTQKEGGTPYEGVASLGEYSTV